MSSQHKRRAEERSKNKNPKNVTILLSNGVRRVITWEEYQEFLKREEYQEEGLA